MHDSERYLVLRSTNALDGLGLPALVVCSRLERTLVERPYDSRACIPVVARGPGVVWYVRQHSYARFSALPPSIVTNALEGLTGSASRLISFWRRVRAAWQADRRSTTASNVSPRVLYDCLSRCGPLAKHLECLQIRTAHRPSTCLKISPGAQKPLNLLPPRRHGVPGSLEPLAGLRRRSSVRCTSLAHAAQPSASSTDWRQITPRSS